MALDRERTFREWQAIRDACAAYHRESMKKSRGGGAVVCICGQGCGGSAACNMLAVLRDLIIHLPDDDLPEGLRDQLRVLRSIV